MRDDSVDKLLSVCIFHLPPTPAGALSLVCEFLFFWNRRNSFSALLGIFKSLLFILRHAYGRKKNYDHAKRYIAQSSQININRVPTWRCCAPWRWNRTSVHGSWSKRTVITIIIDLAVRRFNMAVSSVDSPGLTVFSEETDSLKAQVCQRQGRLLHAWLHRMCSSPQKSEKYERVFSGRLAMIKD